MSRPVYHFDPEIVYDQPTGFSPFWAFEFPASQEVIKELRKPRCIMAGKNNPRLGFQVEKVTRLSGKPVDGLHRVRVLASKVTT